MEAVNISYLGLGFSFLLLLIPLVINKIFQLKIGKQAIWSVLRMVLQLFLVGIFLEYIFDKNSVILNISWFLLMILTAVFSAINKIKVKTKIIILPILVSFVIPTFLSLAFFNAFIVRLDYLFDARYLITLGGMILGNTLSINIVTLNSFYRELKIQKKFFEYRVAMGATSKEALIPFIRQSFQLSLHPILAKTATTGIVTLPGMMSGQIIGGSSPTTAIAYQIAIMIAIFSSGSLSALLTLLFAIKKSFTNLGTLKEGIFKS